MSMLAASDSQILERLRIVIDHVPDWDTALPYKRDTILHSPIFIVGCPRSGTTLLGKCLGEHSRCIENDESMFLVNLLLIYTDLFLGVNRRNWRPLQNWVDSGQLIESLGRLADEILFRDPNRVVVDHTPWYGLMPEFIKALYPRARFIQITRDGRQVTESLTRLYQSGALWAGSSIDYQAELWVKFVNKQLNPAEGDSRSNYRIKYEEFCERPEDSLRKITNWLGLSFESKQLKALQTRHVSTIPNGPTLAKAELSGEIAVTPFMPPDAWPIHWDTNAKDRFMSIAGSALASMGYPV